MRGTLHLLQADEAAIRLFRSFGVGVLVLYAFQMMDHPHEDRAIADGRARAGLDVEVAMGIGVWALLVAGA
jgi:hypothetical protein